MRESVNRVTFCFGRQRDSPKSL